MPIRLNSFTSEVINQNAFTREGGLAKGSHFEVRIHMPKSIKTTTRGSIGTLFDFEDPGSAATQSLSLRCDSISFPSRAPLTADIKYFGASSKRIYGYDAAPVTATILLSQNMIERELMLKWQDIAVGTARKTRTIADAKTFLVGYYNDYTMPLEIIKYNESGFKTHTTTLQEAYPQFVGEVGVDWGNDEFLKINVTFAYRYFTDEPVGGISSVNPNLVSLFQAALNGNLEREAREQANEEIDTRARNLF
jgi:hypothetical protein